MNVPKPTIPGFFRFLMYAVIAGFILRTVGPSLPDWARRHVPNL